MNTSHVQHVDGGPSRVRKTTFLPTFLGGAVLKPPLPCHDAAGSAEERTTSAFHPRRICLSRGVGHGCGLAGWTQTFEVIKYVFSAKVPIGLGDVVVILRN